jgi:hypothetical protein
MTGAVARTQTKRIMIAGGERVSMNQLKVVCVLPVFVWFMPRVCLFFESVVSPSLM